MIQIKHRRQFPELFDSMNLKVGAEVGVYKGDFSKHILENSNVTTLYSIDPWKNEEDLPIQELINICKDKLLPFAERSVIVISPSLEAVNMFEDNQLDFVYIDADHRYQGVKNDLIAWWTKVKTGGVFAGHDYSKRGKGIVPEQAKDSNRGRKGVIQAVDEFVAQHHLSLNLTGEKCKSWWIVKPRQG